MKKTPPAPSAQKPDKARFIVLEALPRFFATKEEFANPHGKPPSEAQLRARIAEIENWERELEAEIARFAETLDEQVAQMHADLRRLKADTQNMRINMRAGMRALRIRMMKKTLLHLLSAAGVLFLFYFALRFLL